jgi:hypothetical protein
MPDVSTKQNICNDRICGGGGGRGVKVNLNIVVQLVKRNDIYGWSLTFKEKYAQRSECQDSND